MPSKPAIEARLLVEDARYESYAADLRARYEKAVEVLLRSATARDHTKMVRLAGEASALKHALGLPADLEKTDPVSPENS